ncbi:MAG TPA: hypothetical protein HA348_05450 [Thermoplasmata archaeon]|nr:hypothetical protein [Thermoplasmata archaeon]
MPNDRKGFQDCAGSSVQRKMQSSEGQKKEEYRRISSVLSLAISINEKKESMANIEEKDLK